MTVLKEKLAKAIETRKNEQAIEEEIKRNDVNSYVWKLARNSDGVQEEIKLMDATPEQLIQFYNHCNSMLYSKDKQNPGRYVLLDIIQEQRDKCNVELFLRKLESGSLCADGKEYPRYLYRQDLRTFLDAHKEQFPYSEWKNISIANCTNGLPREYERISVDSVMAACLDQLGNLDTKHITFSFILNLGICLTPSEMKEFNEKDENGNNKSKLEQIKDRLGMKQSVRLIVKPSGLNFSELRAMINLRPKKYSELTTDQLTALRNKVLFRLENEVMFHIQQWEELIYKLRKVAEIKGVSLE